MRSVRIGMIFVSLLCGVLPLVSCERSPGEATESAAAGAPSQGPFDPSLHTKALAYDHWIRTWHTTGLGGVTDIIFTDASRKQIARTYGAGDSTDWTAFYLVTQCLRSAITGDEVASSEVERIARYLHLVHAVTQHPGYLARYVGYDRPPWNVETLEAENRHQGTGEFEGLFWLGRQSRDKFMHWFWAMAWAYDTVKDEALRETIRADMDRVGRTLRAQGWRIVDPWGKVWPAADLLPDIRLEIMLATAHVTGDPFWQQEFDAEFERAIDILPVTMWHGLNRYYDYFVFINDVPVSNTLFRLVPDRARLERFFDVWMKTTRRYTRGTHYALMDALFYGACSRLGACDPQEVDSLREDVTHGLTVFPNPPNTQRHVDCQTLPLDPFSVWASEILDKNPWLRQLIDIRPQTAIPHTIEDRCWESHLWEGSPYHVECPLPDDPTHAAPGDDYTSAYWFGVYYGLLPGNGPYAEKSGPARGGP